MKRLLPLFGLVVLAAMGFLLWSSSAPPEAPTGSASATTAAPAASPNLSARSGADGGAADGLAAGVAPEARPVTPEQAAKRARLDAEDERADVKRTELFESNIAAVDAAIAKAEAEGANPDYVAALEQRRALLVEQAEAEARD